MPSPRIPLILTAAIALALPRAALGQGSPPLNTNDPALVGRGNLELNFGFAHTRSAGGRDTELPILDANYGFSDKAQLSYVVSWLTARPAGGGRQSGLSNSTLGVKWRFLDGGEKGPSASLHPQLEFNNPGSRAKSRGLVDDGATLTIPFQWQRSFGDWTVTADVGRAFHFKRADDWHGGVSAGRPVGSTLTLGVELFAEAAKHLDRSALLLSFAGTVKVAEKSALLIALGRELHRHDGDRATFVGYLGWQVQR
ncbi:MAG: hypothetical protein JNL39_02555 [Opitutaceae bacterium]|nr:hypothetical protein [Opitutaceae bacterium]